MKIFTQYLSSTAACFLAGIALIASGAVRAADVSTNSGLTIPISSMNWRYAYSCDGYNQDRDDVAGSSMVLAIFDRAGRANNLVHYHFNTKFDGAPTHAEEHRKSVLKTAVLFGIIKEKNADDGFFDVSRSQEEKTGAIQHLAGEIRKSTAEHPLMIFCGGGVQVPCSALELAIKQGASPEALKAVNFVSHSVANERTRQKGNPDFDQNWDNLVAMSPHPRFLDHTSTLINGRRTGEPVKGDQNNTAWNQGPRKGLAGMPNWQWLAAYGPQVEGLGFTGTKGEWLLTRLKAAGAPELGLNSNAEADASDAGMVFGQMPGDKTYATMEEIQNYFLEQTPISDETGFVPLFDEKTLNGWIAAKSTGARNWGDFTVNAAEKSIHVYAGKEGGSKQVENCLDTEKEYSLYILKLEYKWGGKRFAPRADWDRDAGLVFHVHGDLQKVWPASLEMQIGETPGNAPTKGRRFHSGDLFVLAGNLRVERSVKDGFYHPEGTRSYGGHVPTRFGVEKPMGEWNQMEIRVEDAKKATFIFNGEVVYEIFNMQQKIGVEFLPLDKGRIGLQAEWAEILYRNIRIKELPSE